MMIFTFFAFCWDIKENGSFHNRHKRIWRKYRSQLTTWKWDWMFRFTCQHQPTFFFLTYLFQKFHLNRGSKSDSRVANKTRPVFLAGTFGSWWHKHTPWWGAGWSGCGIMITGLTLEKSSRKRKFPFCVKTSINLGTTATRCWPGKVCSWVSKRQGQRRFPGAFSSRALCLKGPLLNFIGLMFPNFGVLWSRGPKFPGLKFINTHHIRVNMCQHKIQLAIVDWK